MHKIEEIFEFKSLALDFFKGQLDFGADLIEVLQIIGSFPDRQRRLFWETVATGFDGVPASLRKHEKDTPHKTIQIFFSLEALAHDYCNHNGYRRQVLTFVASFPERTQVEFWDLVQRKKSQ